MGDAEASSNRGPDFLSIEFFPLDGTRADHLAGHALKVGLSSEVKPKPLHLSEKPSLLMACLSQKRQKPPFAPPEMGPLFLLVDIGHGIFAVTLRRI